MKVTSEQFKTKAENQYGTVYQIKALVDGIEITDEIQDFEYSAMTNPDGEFTFGNTCASQISFKIDTPSQNLTDREIAIQQGIDIDGVVEYVNIGVFKVLKPENTRSVYTYQCVDRMVSRMEMPYFSELTYPATDIDILEEICNQVGISLDNADSLIPHTLQSAPSGYTRREIIGYMAQLQGKNAIINGDGNLELKWYNNVNYTIDDDRIYLDGSDSIKDETNYILGYIECSISTSSDEEIKTIKSGTGNIGIKTENPFMTQEILDEVFSVIGGFSFMPVEVQFLGDFRLEVGDIVTVETYGKTYQAPIMQLNHSSDGGVVTTIESVAETDSENEISFTNPITKQMERYYAELVLINKALVNKLGVEELDAAKAEIEQAIIVSLDTQYAKIDFANIDTAKVDKNIVSLLLAEVGLIDRATIVEGHVTKILDAVEINANSIKSGTIVTDRLLLSGAEGSILFELNNLGELTSTNVNSLDGYVITPRTINADRIIAGSITANEIDVRNLFSQDITATGTIRGAKLIGGLLQSTNYVNNVSGMSWDLTTNAFNSPNMSWNSNGRLTTTDLILSGTTAYKTTTFEDITYGTCEKRMSMDIDEIGAAVSNDERTIKSFLLRPGSLYVSTVVEDETKYISFSETGFNIHNKCSINENATIYGSLDIKSTLKVKSDVYFAGGVDYKVDLYGNATFNKLNAVSETTLNNTLTVTGATTLESTLNVKGATNINNKLSIASGGNQLRIAQGSAGIPFFIRNDGNDTFFLLGNAGSDNYNDLRPLYINNETGMVSMQEGFKLAKNNTFMYGINTEGTEQTLIGINSDNQAIIAPSLSNIYIGNTTSKIFSKGDIVLDTNNKFVYGVNSAGTQYELIGLNSDNRCSVAPKFANIRIGNSPQILSHSGTVQIGASSDSNITYLSGSEVWVCNTAKNAYKVIKASAFTVSSTRKLKENFAPMTYEESSKIYDLEVVDFDYINGEKDQHGLIAEDVVNIIPSVVFGNVNATEPEEIMGIGIDYSRLIPYLIKEIQRHEEENRELKETINNVLLRLQVLEERG